jgi:hypothetical protein
MWIAKDELIASSGAQYRIGKITHRRVFLTETASPETKTPGLKLGVERQY